ncbi:MAG: uroporphyrinogen decarboxylase family protein [Planctomycetota bacterium]|jgi:hypothetical protein
MNPRDIVKQTLEFQSPGRIPRQIWLLPWAADHYPEVVKKLQTVYPDDIIGSPGFCEKPLPGEGDRYALGTSVDDWGCTFVNIQKGAIGEVKDPLLKDWADVDKVRVPIERLTVNKDEVNAFCRRTDRFVQGGTCPRPFEQLQFIRGTENLLLDLMDEPEELFVLMKRMHDLYVKELELWAETEVDALFFMDDWGSQNALLVPPRVWRKLFKPLYKDYVEIAHSNGKYIFMHSDGYITEIMDDLVEIGIDALNSQVFCMGVKELGDRYRGKITFWGELDRQQLLRAGSKQDVIEAVNAMKDHLYDKGGLIGQYEFGLGANPENILAAAEAWGKV